MLSNARFPPSDPRSRGSWDRSKNLYPARNRIIPNFQTWQLPGLQEPMRLHGFWAKTGASLRICDFSTGRSSCYITICSRAGFYHLTNQTAPMRSMFFHTLKVPAISNILVPFLTTCKIHEYRRTFLPEHMYNPVKYDSPSNHR